MIVPLNPDSLGGIRWSFDFLRLLLPTCDWSWLLSKPAGEMPDIILLMDVLLKTPPRAECFFLGTERRISATDIFLFFIFSLFRWSWSPRLLSWCLIVFWDFSRFYFYLISSNDLIFVINNDGFLTFGLFYRPSFPPLEPVSLPSSDSLYSVMAYIY